jgi:hypothetical protein
VKRWPLRFPQGEITEEIFLLQVVTSSTLPKIQREAAVDLLLRVKVHRGVSPEDVKVELRPKGIQPLLKNQKRNHLVEKVVVIALKDQMSQSLLKIKRMWLQTMLKK